jgi:thiol-disulfide isomerase/thioredoxin
MHREEFMSARFFIAAGIVFLFSLGLPGSVQVNGIDRDAILRTSQEWQDTYDQCVLDEAILAAIAAKSSGLTIDVYLGTWCSDSRQHVPVFIRLVDALENSGLSVNYFAVGRKPDKSMKYFVDEQEIERVPTFIVRRDGKEIGRIVETPVKTLAEDILDIVY